MNDKDWLETSKYALKAGDLLRLNLKLYAGGSDRSRRDLLKRINDEHCPREANGSSKKYLRLTLTRLAKIMSGQEYNQHIVKAIIKDMERK